MNALNELTLLVQSKVDFEQLPNQIVHIVGSEFNVLMVGMFFVDTLREFAILKAATNKGGEILVNRGLKFRLLGEIRTYDYVTESVNKDIICVTDETGVFYSKPSSAAEFIKFIPKFTFGFSPLLPPSRFVLSIPLHANRNIFAVLYLEHSEIIEKEKIITSILPIAQKIETVYATNL